MDPEIKQLIQDQNRQLLLLRNQVEQLLSYQEQLNRKKETEETEKCHESTQTSIHRAQTPPSAGRSDPTHNPIKSKRTGSNPAPPQGAAFASRFAQERTEFTLTFRDLHLETIVEQPPSPQQSIVVNMQEYPESISERSDDDSVTESCSSVMEHVQRLLAQQTNLTETRAVLAEKDYDNIHNNNQRRQQHQQQQPVVGENMVRKLTMQRVHELGISFVTPASSAKYVISFSYLQI